MSRELWVTVSGFAFDELRLAELVDINPDAIRINLGRESVEWASTATAFMTHLGYDPRRIYLDVANSKPRVHLASRDDVLECSPGDLLVLHKGERSLLRAVERNEPSVSSWNGAPEGKPVAIGDGTAFAEVIRDTNSILELRVLDAITIPDGTALGGGAPSPTVPDESSRVGVSRLLSTHGAGLLVSFTESRRALRELQEQFPDASSVVAKVETSGAITHIADVVSAGDVFMLGRGDLALSVGLARLGAAQDQAMSHARRVGARAIVATGILESLTRSATPSRAELIDLHHSLHEGAAGIALTSETAGNRDPLRIVRAAKRLLETIE